ncbi:MAG: hypothetical protein ACRD3W_13675, partial [Terriglobales bacterium]
MTEETTVTDVDFADDFEQSIYGDDEDDAPEVCVERGAQSTVLSVKEAALVLGKSIRALERSLSGKWGNRLPEGWSASRRMMNGSEEWQIVPPADFRYEQLLA